MYNDLIYETFFICSIGTTFIGQVTQKCTEMLKYRDDDTSKQVFEVMFEDQNYE